MELSKRSIGIAKQIDAALRRVGDPIERLRIVRELVEYLDATERGMGWLCAGDHSWAEIGAALGMTKQSAWERYHGMTDPPPSNGHQS